MRQVLRSKWATVVMSSLATLVVLGAVAAAFAASKPDAPSSSTQASRFGLERTGSQLVEIDGKEYETISACADKAGTLRLLE